MAAARKLISYGRHIPTAVPNDVQHEPDAAVFVPEASDGPGLLLHISQQLEIFQVIFDGAMLLRTTTTIGGHADHHWQTRPPSAN
jgi:hypothetical protein